MSKPVTLEKLPIQVQAMRYTGKNVIDLHYWSGGKVYVDYPKRDSDPGVVRVITLEGHSYPLKEGDWVIRGVKAEYYPCDNDILWNTYREIKA